jgi:gas vesicle protein
MSDIVGVQVKSGKALLRGLYFGWLLGSTAALLVTPRKGEEARAFLREKSSELKGQAVHSIEDARLRAERLTRAGVNRANELVQQGQVLVSEQRASLLSAVAGVRAGVRAYQDPAMAERPEAHSGEQLLTAIQPAEPMDLSTEVIDSNEEI